MFESAKIKVARAKKHLREIKNHLLTYVGSRPAGVYSEYVPEDRLYALIIRIDKELDAEFSAMIGDFIHNLRSALEHVSSDVFATAFGHAEARERCKFPFGGDGQKEDVKRFLEREGIFERLPNVATAILDGVQPYESGNRTLWWTNRLWNIDKHRLLIFSYQVLKVTGVKAVDASGNIFTGGGETENGIITGLGASDQPLTIQSVGDMAIYVYFNEPKIGLHSDVVLTLQNLLAATQSAIDVIEKAMPQ